MWFLSPSTQQFHKVTQSTTKQSLFAVGKFIQTISYRWFWCAPILIIHAHTKTALHICRIARGGRVHSDCMRLIKGVIHFLYAIILFHNPKTDMMV